MRFPDYRLLFAWLTSVCWLALANDLRAQNTETIAAHGGVIELSFRTPPGESLHQRVVLWVNKAATAVSAYYGQFPVARVRLEVTLRSGHGASGGTTYGYRGALIKISVGRDSTTADFDDDWIMTHEMVHLAFPSVAERHHWIEEGLATYVEPIARARVGQLSTEKIWRDMLDGMSKGLPQAGDRGLDFTPTWGRTYWGGALFCLTADVEIRRRTRGEKGLADALRAILRAGGTIEADWELRRALEIGDRATGAPVLTELYDQWRATPVTPDLGALWQQLGVARRADGSVSLAENAPLAAIRRSITSP